MNMNETMKANGYELEKVEETSEKVVYMLKDGIKIYLKIAIECQIDLI